MPAPPHSLKETSRNSLKGEANVWLCGLGLGLGLAMIVILLAYIFVKGMEVFTPAPIHIYTHEAGTPEEPRQERLLAEFRRAQTKRLPGEPEVAESNLFVGSREYGGAFRWVRDDTLSGKETPAAAMRVERTEMGHVLGLPVELRLGNGRTLAPSDPAFDKELAAAVAEVVRRRAEIRRLEVGEIGALAHRITRAKQRLAAIENASDATAEEIARRAEPLRQDIAEWETRSSALMDQARALREQQKLHSLALDIVRRDEPVVLSFDNIVSIEQPNAMGFWGKTGTVISRFWNFLTDWPRDANTDGGIWPAIFGTFVMTIIMCIFVTPLGVMAAIYLREYAKQGLLVRAVRISVNNLAGVPSIIFGVFGVAFFIYTMGSFIDSGPAHPVSTGVFWALAALFIVIAFAALYVTVLNSPKPGRAQPGIWMRRLAVTLWSAFALLAIGMIWTNPFFTGFYRDALPAPTFGTGGILWASLTLALLTLPVVIVATEEAIAAVPRGVREAALACGASKWQMIQRVVLPASSPGILTGVILAMARGAGEVAPLMLVGVIPAASTLVIDGAAPFIHAERKFMHLGFHIFDVGFQSPDSEAARPLVFATTFVLIVLVVLMNLAAILIRNTLRKRLQTNAF